MGFKYNSVLHGWNKKQLILLFTACKLANMVL